MTSSVRHFCCFHPKCCHFLKKVCPLLILLCVIVILFFLIVLLFILLLLSGINIIMFYLIINTKEYIFSRGKTYWTTLTFLVLMGHHLRNLMYMIEKQGWSNDLFHCCIFTFFIALIVHAYNSYLLKLLFYVKFQMLPNLFQFNVTLLRVSPAPTLNARGLVRVRCISA